MKKYFIAALLLALVSLIAMAVTPRPVLAFMFAVFAMIFGILGMIEWEKTPSLPHHLRNRT